MAIEKGTVKVVWISRGLNRIYSKMFDDAEDAKRFAAGKKDCLVFSLVWHRNYREYCWKLLPFGRHRLYTNALKIYRKKKLGRLFGL